MTHMQFDWVMIFSCARVVAEGAVQWAITPAITRFGKTFVEKKSITFTELIQSSRGEKIAPGYVIP